MFIMSRSNTGVQQVNEHDFNYGTDTGGVILSRTLGDGFSVGARYNLGDFRTVPLTYQSDRMFRNSFSGRIVPVTYEIFADSRKPNLRPYEGFKIPSFTAIPFEYVCNHRYKMELTFENLDTSISAPSEGWDIFAYTLSTDARYMRLVYILTGSRLAVGKSFYDLGSSSWDFRHLKIISRLPEDGDVSDIPSYPVDASEVVGVWGIVVYATPSYLGGYRDSIVIGNKNGSSGISSMSSLNVVSEQFMPNGYSGVWQIAGTSVLSCRKVETGENQPQTLPYVLALNDDIVVEQALNVF